MMMYQPDVARPSAVPEYPFTNDMGLGEVYEQVHSFNQTHPWNEADCAVIVGAGGLLSMADVLPKTIFVTDKDPLLLEWVAKNIKALLDPRDPFAYSKTATSHPYMSETEREIFGNYYFLSSPERYLEAQRAIAQRAIRYALLDYGQKGEVEALAEAIGQQGNQVRLFNATNMHRHIGTDHKNNRALLDVKEYATALKSMPWASQFMILSSAIDALGVRSLPVQESLEGYAAIAFSGHQHADKKPTKRRRSFLRRQ